MPPFRMTSQRCLVLLSLVGEKRHGSAVIRRVTELSNGAVTLAAGTLYDNLDRLLAAGLVQIDGEEVVDGRTRYYYRATASGAQAAQAETERLAGFASQDQQALDLPDAPDRPTDPQDHPADPAPRRGYESSARRWMHAYPRRWRVTFGDDLVATLLDVAEPDARRLRPRDALSIVAAGWSLRWRWHPPFWRWLGYRALSMRLPPRYRYWVMDDLRSRFLLMRQMLTALVLITAIVGVAGLFVGFDFWGVFLRNMSIWMLASGALGTVVLPRARARYEWYRHCGPTLPDDLKKRRDRVADLARPTQTKG